LFFLSRLGAESDIKTMMMALAVVGLGTGAFISPNNSALMGSAPKSRQGIAAGILATARNFGMVLGVGIAGAIFTTALARGTSASISAGGMAQSGVMFPALQLSFMVASGITILGVITSMVRASSNE
jgi:hypothetical protein